MQPILILTNCDSLEEAEGMADQLLEKRLAAAVQIVGPAISRYRWQGEICKKKEWMVLVKTNDKREAEINVVIKGRHTYEMPGIMKLSIDGGENQYLQWILDQSKGGELS